MEKKLRELDREESSKSAAYERAKASAETPKRRRGSNLLLVTLGSIFLLALGGTAGVLGYKYLFEDSVKPISSEQHTSQPAKQSETNTKNAETLVAEIKAKLKSTQVATESESQTSTKVHESTLPAHGVPEYQPEGYSFSTSPRTFYGLTVASSSDDTFNQDYLTIKQHLLANNLRNYGSTVPASSEVTTQSIVANASVVCEVQYTTYQYKEGRMQLQLGCADTDSYAETAKQLKPYYDAYVASDPNVKDAGYILLPADPTQSKTEGYRTVRLRLGDSFGFGSAAGLFYETPDKKWHFFSISQAVLSCSEYDTDDLKKAYVGETCDDNGRQTTVKL